MPQPLSSLRQRALRSLAAGERFLLARQCDDGLWRDYDALAPGPSEAWVSAVVACSLSMPPFSAAGRPAIAAVADALHGLRTPQGWGYNRHTTADADTTAWVWRLLGRIDDFRGCPALDDLGRRITADGTACTYTGADYGEWAGAHEDVTPIVGLALLAVGAPPALTAHVRRAVLRSLEQHGTWHAYWWTSDAYAVAANVEFLQRGGGVPASVAARARDWLDAAPPAATAFDLAQRASLSALAIPSFADRLCGALVAGQARDGGWQASPTLRVPQQRPLRGAAIEAYADERRLMSTAMAVAAIKRWLACAKEKGATLAGDALGFNG
jgi:hypothetical protein